MLIEPNSNLLFIGDSITDCDRDRPVGEGLGLGNGYVGLVNALLEAAHPEASIRILNMGIGGNTIRDLAARWQTDVRDLKPDWLSIMIGINDVWRQFDSPLQIEWHVSYDEYSATLEQLIRITQPKLKGLILMTPYFIEPNRSDAMRAMMNQYGAGVRRLAEKYHAVFVDTQAAFDDALEYYQPQFLAPDRVHPSQTGHMILARVLLNAIGFAW